MASEPAIVIGRLSLYPRDLLMGPLMAALIIWLIEGSRAHSSSWLEMALKFLGLSAFY